MLPPRYRFKCSVLINEMILSSPLTDLMRCWSSPPRPLDAATGNGMYASYIADEVLRIPGPPDAAPGL